MKIYRSFRTPSRMKNIIAAIRFPILGIFTAWCLHPGPMRAAEVVDANAVARAPVQQVPSPGHTTYFVDPVRGDDANHGTAAQTPWRSLAKVNALRLAPGDKVVIAPGQHDGTLMPAGAGTAQEPIV